MTGFIAQVEHRIQARASSVAAESGRLSRAVFQVAASAGKRLRASLVLAASQAVANQPPNNTGLISYATAVELLHAYSLVHDDLPSMDDAETRRGQPTIHRQFDEATAILTGDILQALAFAELADQADIDVIRKFAEAATDLVIGQSLDLTISASGRGDIRAMINLKTARLFGLSAWLGGRLSDPQWMAALYDYGLRLGASYQKIDDWVDANHGERTASNLCQAIGLESVLAEIKADLERLRLEAKRFPNPQPLTSFLNRLWQPCPDALKAESPS